MTLYQLHKIMPNGSAFALPVYGEKRRIWDALARHLGFSTYRKFCEVQGVNPSKHQPQFKLIQVQS